MKVNEHKMYVFGTCVSLFQERYMDGKQVSGLLCLDKHVNCRVLSQEGVVEVYIRGSCILMRWSDNLHLVAHYGYSLDIGNTDGLTALMNIHEQVHNVIDLP